VALYGSPLPQTVPFPCQNLGVLSPRELAALYRRATVGVVFSLTNLSLVTQEMMASGLPVVELDGENVQSVLCPSGNLAMLAAPTPDAVADSVEYLLSEPDSAAGIAQRARAFVEGRTWEKSGLDLSDALKGFLACPRPESPAPTYERTAPEGRLAARTQ
jgi:glycosyltransferase involved in cell wall biosynthesis